MPEIFIMDKILRSHFKTIPHYADNVVLPGTKMKKSRRQENTFEGILPSLFMLAGRGTRDGHRAIRA